MNELLFYLSVFAANIVQGVTGFAGAILALPPGSYFVGLGVAVPVLNGLGIVSGGYVLVESGSHVDRKTLAHVIAIMVPCGLVGILVRRSLSFDEALLNHILGAIVLLIAVRGIAQFFQVKMAGRAERHPASLNGHAEPRFSLFNEAVVCLSGIVHGMYACGGPLLVGYLARALPEKASFRSTVSAVWVVLNTAMLVSQIAFGEWNPSLLRIQLMAIPFLLAGMYVGSLLYKRVSQEAFTLLTYALLVVSAILLLMR